jgi:SNF2 family DNA or RNA helicase
MAAESESEWSEESESEEETNATTSTAAIEQDFPEFVAVLAQREQLSTHADKEIPPPADFRGTLKPYQLVGYRWLISRQCHGLNTLLGDQMGTF